MPGTSRVAYEVQHACITPLDIYLLCIVLSLFVQ
jgi:hypothetical protein